MPQIRQYSAPEGLTLHPTETGITATAAAARRVQGAFNEAAASKKEIAADIEATGRRFGSAVQSVGDVAIKAIEHQEISHGAAGFASLAQSKTQEWNDIVKTADPNDPTLARKFVEENLEPDLEKFRSSFLTEGGQRWVESHVDQLRQHMFRTTSADMSRLAGDAVVVNQHRTINALSNTVRADPSSMDFSLQTLESATNGVIGSSPNISPTDASRVRMQVLQKGKEDIIKSAALGYIEKTGTVPPWTTDEKYAPYINGAELKQLAQAARYYQRLGESENRAARVQRDYEAKVDFNGKINKLEVDTMPQNVGDEPTLPKDYWQRLRALGTHPGAAFEPGRLKTMVTNGEAITSRLNKPEPLARVSHDTTVDLLKRIRASDDSRLTDNGPIYDAYQNGELTNADFNFLTREFVNMRSPDGLRLAQRKDEFLKSVTPSIDKSNPLMGKIDQDGKSNVYRLMVDVERKMEEYRKAGKNPYDLLDPSKPEFMGKPEALEPYRKPLAESMRDTARRLSGGSARPQRQPRKAGETPEQYLKRIGGQ